MAVSLRYGGNGRRPAGNTYTGRGLGGRFLGCSGGERPAVEDSVDGLRTGREHAGPAPAGRRAWAVSVLEGIGAGAAQVSSRAGPPDCLRPAGRPDAGGTHGDAKREGMTGRNGLRSARVAPGRCRMTVKASAGGSLPGPMSRSSLKVSVSQSPRPSTSALAGIGGVMLATVELLVTGKSSKATASLPATSAMTVPVSGTS